MVVSVALVIVVVSAMFFAISSSSPCDGVSFHLREAPQVSTPSVGGHQSILVRLRNLFGLGESGVSYCHDFADPFVLRVGDRYYAYSTNSGGRNMMMRSSR